MMKDATESAGAQMTRAYYLGIDAGTSGLKALVIDGHGKAVAQGTASYALRTSRPGWVEGDPEEWWSALCARRPEPVVWARACVALLPKDYLRLRLTGVAATDPTDAGATGLLHLQARDWPPARPWPPGPEIRSALRSAVASPRPARCSSPSAAADRSSPPPRRLSPIPTGACTHCHTCCPTAGTCSPPSRPPASPSPGCAA